MIISPIQVAGKYIEFNVEFIVLYHGFLQNTSRRSEKFLFFLFSDGILPENGDSTSSWQH